ncbi:MAG: hypothetical protein M3P87_07765 [Actinomycetota bacterium]|nr:hypothetical protein [Actinomycetota bacterium]
MSRSRLLIIGFVLLAACGDGVSGETTLGTSTTTTAATTTTQPSTTVTTATSTTQTTVVNIEDLAEGSGCTPGEGPLPDGLWFGFVTSRTEETLDFDLACWFTGDAATRAAAEEGQESPPPNDYYVRNTNPEIRTITIGDLVEVGFFPDGDPNNQMEIDYDDWAGMVAARGYELGTWLAIEEGVIAEIQEQWVP